MTLDAIGIILWVVLYLAIAAHWIEANIDYPDWDEKSHRQRVLELGAIMFLSAWPAFMVGAGVIIIFGWLN